MKDLCAAVYEYLCNYESVVACVEKRIYPLLAPQEVVAPFVVYSVVSTKYDSALDGDTKYIKTVLQFNCYDNTFSKARRAGTIIRKAFQDFRGSMCGVDIQGVYINLDFVTLISSTSKTENEIYVNTIELEIDYLEE